MRAKLNTNSNVSRNECADMFFMHEIFLAYEIPNYKYPVDLPILRMYCTNVAYFMYTKTWDRNHKFHAGGARYVGQLSEGKIACRPSSAGPCNSCTLTLFKPFFPAKFSFLC